MRRAAPAGFLLLALAACGEQAPPASAAPGAADALTPAQQAAVRALVRDTLVENPDILLEAQRAFEARQNADVAKRLAAESGDFAVGPADAKVVVVQFFDYRCPYCHTANEWTWRAIEAHKDVRFVFKELPILSDQSERAARAAIAADKQGKYPAMHRALMQSRGTLDDPQIDQIARAAGLDVARMRRDMNAPAVGEHLERVRALAMELGVSGTPAFFINGRMIGGFSQRDLDQAIADATKA